MSLIQVCLIVLTVLALSIGQVLFKLAARDIRTGPDMIMSLFFNRNLLLAAPLYIIATGLWVALLRTVPLKIAYPFAALAYIFVPLLAYMFVGEDLSWRSFVGALIILLGVWISVSR
jgi:drug/metabolite transporter (DMT)-like permease